MNQHTMKLIQEHNLSLVAMCAEGGTLVWAAAPATVAHISREDSRAVLNQCGIALTPHRAVQNWLAGRNK